MEVACPISTALGTTGFIWAKSQTVIQPDCVKKFAPAASGRGEGRDIVIVQALMPPLLLVVRMKLAEPAEMFAWSYVIRPSKKLKLAISAKALLKAVVALAGNASASVIEPKQVHAGCVSAGRRRHITNVGVVVSRIGIDRGYSRARAC